VKIAHCHVSQLIQLVTLDEAMENYVRKCTQTWVRVSKFEHAHDHVSQRVA